MPFAAALSRHPVASHAVGEVVGEVLERLGLGPDLVVLFATGSMTGALDDIGAAVRNLLLPRCLVGATAMAILGGGAGVEEEPAIGLWAARFAGRSSPTPIALGAGMIDGAIVIHGLDELLDAVSVDDDRWALVLADPFSFPTDAVLTDLAGLRPRLRLIGGLASAARGPGGNRLILDRQLLTSGAVIVILPPGVEPTTVVAQACRPVGQPFIVTRAERNIVYELAGRPALERLNETLAQLNPSDRRLASQGLHCGIVVDEHKSEFERGDFLVRQVLGGDRSVGAIAIGDHVEVGSTVQFHLRDPGMAGDDLSELIARHPGDAALVFTCTARGSQMFGTPHHDAGIIDDLLEPTGPSRPAVTGMFCAGEIGPVGGRSALLSFTASIAVFTDLPSPDS